MAATPFFADECPAAATPKAPPDEQGGMHDHISRTLRPWDLASCAIGFSLALGCSRATGALPVVHKCSVLLYLGHFWALQLAPAFYARNRTAICLASHLWPFLTSILLYWPSGGGPTASASYAALVAAVESRPKAWHGLVVLLAREPLLRLAQGLLHAPLPFAVHAACTAVRALADAVLVVPALSCALAHPRLAPLLDAAGAWPLLQQLGLSGHAELAWFAAAAALLVVGHLVPLVAVFWLEAWLQAAYYRRPGRCSPGQLVLPGRAEVCGQLLAQLLQGLVVVLCYSGFLSSLAPLLSSLACRAA